MALFERAGVRVIPTGLKHGTVTAVLNKENFEVTTLRIDAATDGRWADVQFTKDWRVDAERRDLTFNAMSMDLEGGIVDHFGGVEDLAAGRVRFVGDAAARITEDYLRILRYFRFHARICATGEHEPECAAAMRAHGAGLAQVSGERIWSEFAKILAHERGVTEVGAMLGLGVLRPMGLPWVGPQHVAELARVCEHSADPVTRLVALLETEDQALEVHARWHLRNAHRDQAVYLVRGRTRGGLAGLEAAQDELVEGVPPLQVHEALLYGGLAAEAAAVAQWRPPDFPMTGKKLVASGFKPGPGLGKTLRALKDAWKRSRFAMTEQELAALAQLPPP